MIGENLLRPEPTLLPEEPDVLAAQQRGETAETIVRAHPESPLAWADLADEAWAQGRTLDAYAYARVGYHRGLDKLRRAGWRGTGPVPWTHEPNRGVLRCLYGLRRASDAIGETAEVDRLSEFLQDADPSAVAHIEGQ